MKNDKTGRRPILTRVSPILYEWLSGRADDNQRSMSAELENILLKFASQDEPKMKDYKAR